MFPYPLGAIRSGGIFFAKILVKSIYLCYNRCATQLNQQTFHGIALYFYEGFLTMPFLHVNNGFGKNAISA